MPNERFVIYFLNLVLHRVIIYGVVSVLTQCFMTPKITNKSSLDLVIDERFDFYVKVILSRLHEARRKTGQFM